MWDPNKQLESEYVGETEKSTNLLALIAGALALAAIGLAVFTVTCSG